MAGWTFGRTCVACTLAALVVVGLLALTHAPDPATSAVVVDPLVARPLQPMIDATPSGGVLRLEPGLYAGPVVIARPMVLRGRSGVMIDGGGVGTVVTVEADGVTLRGVAVRNSGDRADTLDAAVRVTGQRAVVEDNVVEDCLHGIVLQQSSGTYVRANRIASKDVPEEGRGDAVRVWYGRDNVVEANLATRVRDGISVQAVGNRIRDNRVHDSRYGIQLLHGDDNVLSGNRLIDDAVGIMAIASDRLVIEANLIRSGRDIAGQGVILKDSGRARVIGNDLFASAQAIFIDASPSDPEDINLFRDNRFVHNGTAVAFHSDLAGNAFEANRFVGNHTEVVVRGGGTALRNVWRDNEWDAWVGFDRDGDGIGDTPFEVWSWADQIWMDVPEAQLFRAAPSLTLVDFVERLAPFAAPRLLLRDSSPRLVRAARPTVEGP